MKPAMPGSLLAPSRVIRDNGCERRRCVWVAAIRPFRVILLILHGSNAGKGFRRRPETIPIDGQQRGPDHDIPERSG